MAAGLGWRPSSDPRDASFPLRLALLAPEPQQPMASSRVFASPVPPLNQGATSSCVAHAWTHWLLSSPLKTPGTDPFELYRACLPLDEWPENDGDGQTMAFGTSLRAGAKALQARGRLGTYLWTKREADIRSFILTGQGPVVVGTYWYDGMQRPTELTMQAKGARRGGHAYLLGGYLETRRAYLVVNSWGLGWGERGRAFLPAETLGRLLDEDGEAVAGVELVLSPLVSAAFQSTPSGHPNAMTGSQPSPGSTTQTQRTNRYRPSSVLVRRPYWT